MRAFRHTVECNDTEDEHNGQGHDHNRVNLEAGRLISVQPYLCMLAPYPHHLLSYSRYLAYSHIPGQSRVFRLFRPMPLPNV
jgi:hypothetical protein